MSTHEFGQGPEQRTAQSRTPRELEPIGDVRSRIMAAAVAVASDHGIARLTLGDVAKRAGLSRQTLYRHFTSKEELVTAAVTREAARIIEQVMAAAEPHADAVDAIRVSFCEALVAMRTHPLLDRLLRTEPEALLPLLVGGGIVVGVVRDTVELIVAQRIPDLPADQVARFADLPARLLVSYAIAPPESTPEEIAEVVAAVLWEGVKGVIESIEASTGGES